MSQDLENVFIQLVDTSWKKYDEVVHNTQKDDMLVGAVIAAMVEDGFSLIDLTSDGRAHYLRFEHLPSKQRLIFRLENMSEDLITAKVLGRNGRIVIGYGERVQNTAALWQTLKQEVKSAYLDAAEPGVITADADISSGYLYVQIPLILNLEPYFKGEYSIDYTLLRQHVTATVQALQKYLRGRIQS